MACKTRRSRAIFLCLLLPSSGVEISAREPPDSSTCVVTAANATLHLHARGSLAEWRASARRFVATHFAEGGEVDVRGVVDAARTGCPVNTNHEFLFSPPQIVTSQGHAAGARVEIKPCSVPVGLGANRSAFLRVDGAAPFARWHAAARAFAHEHGLVEGGPCGDPAHAVRMQAAPEECVSNQLLGSLLAGCDGRDGRDEVLLFGDSHARSFYDLAAYVDADRQPRAGRWPKLAVFAFAGASALGLGKARSGSGAGSQIKQIIQRAATGEAPRLAFAFGHVDADKVLGWKVHAAVAVDSPQNPTLEFATVDALVNRSSSEYLAFVDAAAAPIDGRVTLLGIPPPHLSADELSRVFSHSTESPAVAASFAARARFTALFNLALRRGCEERDVCEFVEINDLFEPENGGGASPRVPAAFQWGKLDHHLHRNVALELWAPRLARDASAFRAAEPGARAATRAPLLYHFAKTGGTALINAFVAGADAEVVTLNGSAAASPPPARRARVMWCVEASSSATRALATPLGAALAVGAAPWARAAPIRVAILREPVARCASRARYLLRDRALDLHYFEYASGEMKDIASVDELAPLLVEGSVLDFGAFDERHVTEPDRLWVELERSCGNEYVAYFGRRDETRAVRYSGARGAEAATADEDEELGAAAAAAYARARRNLRSMEVVGVVEELGALATVLDAHLPRAQWPRGAIARALVEGADGGKRAVINEYVFNTSGTDAPREDALANRQPAYSPPGADAAAILRKRTRLDTRLHAEARQLLAEALERLLVSLA